ncbi:glycosyltransferase family 39 protein [bacterium]|nr:glycosyltransferase family 39 protein [bacterium]
MIVVAAAVRLVYLAQYRNSPFFLVPIWDAADYHNIAVSFSQAKIDPILSFRAPLYPLFLGMIYLITGVGDLMPRLVQIVIGISSCVLVMRIGERLFGKAAGTVAGLITAVTGLMVYFELELLPTTLFIFLILLFILELLKLKDGDGSAVRAGLFFALGVLTRPVILTFLPLAVVWFLWIKTPSRHLVRFLTFAMLPLVLSLLLHVLAGSGTVLVSAQGGINYYIGNHHEADGATARFPGIGTGWGWEEMRRIAVSRAGRPLLDSEIDRLYWLEGLKEIVSHPVDWLKLMTRKAFLFWNKIEIPNNRDFYYHARSFPLIGKLMLFGFPFLLPWALSGVVLNWKRSGVKLLTAFFLIYYITTIQFFITARFRHPLTPLLIIMAVGGITGIVRMFRTAEKSGRVKWIVLITALLVGLVLPRAVHYRIDLNDDSYGLFTEGRAWEKLGKTDKAEILYMKALKAKPTAPFANFSIAEIAHQRGDFFKAVDYFKRELEVQPNYAKAWNNLGVMWTELDHETEALACFERALAINREMTEAARNAARIWSLRGVNASKQNEWKIALGCFEKALSFDPASALYMTMYLEALFRLGAVEEATKGLDGLLSRHPGFPPAFQLLEEIQRR